MATAHFGLIGLGVMGENLVLNAERNGFSSVVWNRTFAKTQEFLGGRGAGRDIIGAETLPEFVAALERPRRILMMVKAGQRVVGGGGWDPGGTGAGSAASRPARCPTTSGRSSARFRVSRGSMA